MLFYGLCEEVSSVIITEFLFDDANEEEFATHGLSAIQVNQILDNRKVSFPNRRQDIHRGSYMVIGRDNGGAPITVPVEATHIATLWRPVTAWRSEGWQLTILEKQGI